MGEMDQLLERLGARLKEMARANAVVGETISVGGRHAVPLCELNLAIGGGTGQGEEGGATGSGMGGGAGGGAKATPVAVIVVEGGRARVQMLQ
ncbi:MAG: hypothetical protein H6746_01545 [Deltaproteobacteria bacterium]|nr:hypothetical protein [Deltaproteobacteria bacterium]